MFLGHSFRRSSATLAANAGADITTLKRLGEWKSDKVANSYVEESLQTKKKIAELINTNINQSIVNNDYFPSKTNLAHCNVEPEPYKKQLNSEVNEIILSPEQPNKRGCFTFKTPKYCTFPKPHTYTSTLMYSSPNKDQDTVSETSSSLSQYIIEEFVSQPMELIQEETQFETVSLKFNF